VGVSPLILFALLIALALCFCGTSYVLRRRRRERHESGDHVS
jgi:cbb3-type cytochrome oxidase subunit 3